MCKKLLSREEGKVTILKANNSTTQRKLASLIKAKQKQGAVNKYNLSVLLLVVSHLLAVPIPVSN
jgi:hypothetical protein